MSDQRMTPSLTTFASHGLRVVQHPHLGRQVVTDRAIIEREIVAIWRGHTISQIDALKLGAQERDQLLQVGLDEFMVNRELCVVDYINHSCDPNCGFLDSTTLAAMRNIDPGETITFDYAMSDCNSFIGFDCACASSACRGRLTKDDWQLPDLQQRYLGWWAPHIRQLIEGVD